MKGSIIKRGNAFSVVIDLGKDANGKRVQKWFKVDGGKRDAEALRIRKLAELQDGTLVENTKMTVPQYLEYWLANHARLRVSGKTFERFSEIVHQHLIPAFPMPLSKLRPTDVQQFLTKAETSGRKDGKGGLSRQTLKHFYRLLKSVMGQAVKDQLLKVNPLNAVACPKVPRKDYKIVDADGVLELLELAHKWQIYPAVLMACYTGMRRGEVCALRWSDVDLDRGQASVARTLEETKAGLNFKDNKTAKSRRAVRLLPSLVSELRRHKAEQAKIRLMMGTTYNDNGLIFCRADGSPYPPDVLSGVYRSMVRATKFQGVRFHDLRHSFASIHFKIGTQPKIVSEALGHANIGITMDLYSHTMPGMQESAAAQLEAAFQTAQTAKDKR